MEIAFGCKIWNNINGSKKEIEVDVRVNTFIVFHETTFDSPVVNAKEKFLVLYFFSDY